MRQPSDLARIDGAVDVQHLLSWHADGLGHGNTLVSAVAWMAAAEVISHAPSNQIKLNPAADAVAVRIGLRLFKRQHLGLKKLQLQRHKEPILRPSGPQAHEALARHKHLACDHGLQAVEIGQPICVRLVRPGEPELLDLVPQCRIRDKRRRLDTVPNKVGRKGLAGVRRITVGHYQFARPRQQFGSARSDERVDVLERWVPAPQAPLCHRPFKPRAHGFSAARLGAAEQVEHPHFCQSPLAVVTRTCRTIRRPSAIAISRSKASMARSISAKDR